MVPDGGPPKHPSRRTRADTLASVPDESIATFRASSHVGDGTVVVVANGELDLVGAPRLLQAMPGEGSTPVVLDLGGVQFMDSSGLRSLLEARQACIDAGRPFAIARPSTAVTRVLELVDLSGEFEVVDAPPAPPDQDAPAS
jgi:anti-sigma B factor antagonist